MRCVHCGQETSGDNQTCDRCSTEADVQVLSRQERDSFQGVTIDQGNRTEERASWQRDGGSRIYVKSIDLNKSSWLNKLLIAAAVIAFLFAGVFIGGVVLALAIIGWLVSKILFQR